MTEAPSVPVPVPADRQPEARHSLALLAASRLTCRLAVECCYFVGVLGTAAYTLGADAFAISAMAFINALFGGLGMMVSGPLCDRIGPRRTVLGANVLLAVLFLGASFVPLTLGSLGMVTACWTFAMGFQTTGFVAYPPYLVADRGLARANSIMETAANVAVIIGSLLGGVVAVVSSPQWVFLVGAVATALSAVCVWFLREDPAIVASRKATGPADPADAGEKSRGLKGRLAYMAQGVTYTFGHPALRLLLAMGFMGFLVFGAFDSLESLFYRDVLRVSADWMGWLTAVCGVGSVIGSALIMVIPRRWRGLQGCALMTMVLGLGTMVYVGTASVAVAALGQLILSIGWGGLVPIQNMLVQEHAPVEAVGRVGSVMRIGFQAAGVVPLFFAPVLAAMFGPQAVLFSGACFCALVGVGFLTRTVRAYPWPGAGE